MMTQESAPQYSHDYFSGDISEHLQAIVVKVCLCRLLFLILLLIPLVFFWIDQHLPQVIFLHFQKPIYTIFLITGFALTIFFLLSWPYFQNIILFFRIQLIIDSLLVFFLILLTGGITSNFSFLLLGLIFLYGRILGLKTSVLHALSVGIFFLAISFSHYHQPSLWSYQRFSLYHFSYYSILQILAIVLVLFLLRLGKGREEELLHSLNQHKLELEYAETLKSQVFDWMSSGLIVIDNSGHISTINRMALEWIKNKNDFTIIGQALGRFFPKFKDKWTQWDKKEAIRTEIPDNATKQIFGATFTPLPEKQGSLILFSDITKIKELEKQVQEMEKLSTVGELASGLAHEIKNPLAGIKASLQLINQNTIDKDQKAKLYQIIHRDVYRLDHLLSNFLLFAKPSQADFQYLNIHKSIHTCLESLQLQRENINIELSSSLKNISCQFDHQHFQQIVLNILLNAVQAVEKEENPYVFIGWDQDHKGTFIAFRDNGPGIDRDKKDSLFDPFVTTKKDGTGLGLPIAQRLAVQNDAWVELNNLSSRGAEARIYFSSPIPTNSAIKKD